MTLIIGDIFCIWIVIFSIFKPNFNEDVVSRVRLRLKLLRHCYCYVDTPVSGGGSNNNNLIIIVVVVVVVVLLLVFVVVVVIVVLRRRRREYSHYDKLFTNVIYDKTCPTSYTSWYHGHKISPHNFLAHYKEQIYHWMRFYYQDVFFKDVYWHYAHYIAILYICHPIFLLLSSFIYHYFITCLACRNQVAVCQPLLKSYLIWFDWYSVTDSGTEHCDDRVCFFAFSALMLLVKL